MDSLFVSFVAVGLAIVSPFITSLVNNHHENKRYNRKFYIEYKSNVIENYIRLAGRTIKYADVESMREYGGAYGEIFMYAPKDLWPKIKTLDKEIRFEQNYEVAADMLSEISQQLLIHNPRTNTHSKGLRRR